MKCSLSMSICIQNINGLNEILVQTLTGTPRPVKRLGFIIVTSWCRRSGCVSNNSGATDLIASSKDSASPPGTPYHVLGSPLKNLMLQYY